MAIPCILILINSVIANDEFDIVFDDFESEVYRKWEISGDAFGPGPAHGTLDHQNQVSGYRGNRLVNTFFQGDSSTGTLFSKPFKIERKYICFLIGGGSGSDVGVALVIDGVVERTRAGKNSEALAPQAWNVEEFLGRDGRLKIFDQSTGGWGHLCLDQIVFSNDENALGKLAERNSLRLSSYRKSKQYYREKYRPQFHFTPEINWMNDPNGLVYYDGEYHLFYQHNPHGNEWGHMSWGHAVSRDLVHWEHLPIALHEEYGVMVFSGCCVIDHANTSGFGNGEVAPMVAIYTGHSQGLQTQDLAYSNDRGRTWTKYPGNPVIDIGLADFRDPKVFWHAQSNKWVMVVAKAVEKVVSFYGSKDLKTWDHLSDFGSAGVSGKPNWECPDLFELPVENVPNERKWVLEVDMGDGSIAGGSGGEYFVGQFDGREFQCDHDPTRSQWVDYGRDFYAPVSWSNIPKQDGRRIWIGWMNNWETHLLPTSPWRSAMSIPRQLSLRKTRDRYTLIQRPVAELQELRQQRFQFENILVENNSKLELEKAKGNRFEAIITFEPDEKTTEFGIQVRVGKGEQTIVGIDRNGNKLFVDRSDSGVVDFHPSFAGKYFAPLNDDIGTFKLHLLVDESSIEVFTAGGQIAITNRIFPEPDSSGVRLYSIGGNTIVKNLQLWKLDSIWN